MLEALNPRGNDQIQPASGARARTSVSARGDRARRGSRWRAAAWWSARSSRGAARHTFHRATGGRAGSRASSAGAWWSGRGSSGGAGAGWSGRGSRGAARHTLHRTTSGRAGGGASRAGSRDGAGRAGAGGAHSGGRLSGRCGLGLQTALAEETAGAQLAFVRARAGAVVDGAAVVVEDGFQAGARRSAARATFATVGVGFEAEWAGDHACDWLAGRGIGRREKSE